MKERDKEQLTIGIPTYNRPHELIRQLQRISKSIGFEKIHVIVSDNSENNMTQEMVQNFLASSGMKNIEYNKNIRNIGFDGNIVSIYNKATTEYVWFLSDDDPFLLSNIEILLSDLSEKLPDLVCVNAYSKRKIPFYSDGQKVRLAENCDRVLQIDMDRAISINNAYDRAIALKMIAFISSCLVRKKVEYIDSASFAHLGGIPQVFIANINVLQSEPIFFVTRYAGVASGIKPNYSAWFMMSSFYGVKECLSNTTMQLPKDVQDLYVCDVLLYVLNEIARSLIGKSSVPISADFDLIKELKLCKITHKNNAHYLAIASRINQCEMALAHSQCRHICFNFYKSVVRRLLTCLHSFQHD